MASLPDVRRLVTDPEWQNLPYEERYKALQEVDPELAALPSEQRGMAIRELQMTHAPAEQGFVESFGDQIGEMVRGVPAMISSGAKMWLDTPGAVNELLDAAGPIAEEIKRKSGETARVDPTLGKIELAGRIASTLFPGTEKAGEQIGRGNYAGGLGTALGAVAPMLVSPVVKGIRRIGNRTVPGGVPREIPPAAREVPRTRPAQAAPRTAPHVGMVAGEGIPGGGPRGAGEPAGVPLPDSNMSIPERLVTKAEQLETEAQVPPENVSPLQYADKKGIPVSVGQATGSERWQAAEATASTLTDDFIQNQRKAIDILKGEAEKKKAGLTGLSTKSEQGQAVQKNINKLYRNALADEDAAWKAFYGNAPGLMVDLAATKEALKPIVAQIERELPASLREKSPGFPILKQILERPDSLDIVTAQADISALKNIARGRGFEQEFPQVVSKSRALAKIAVKEYQGAINNAVDTRGPGVRSIYDLANRSTVKRADIEKFQRPLVRLQNNVDTEGTSVIEHFTRDHDSSFNRLTALKARSPESMDTVAGAIISDAISKATRNENQAFSPRIFNTEISKVGPRTMNLLFGPEGAAEIRDMAGVGRMLGQEFNPSRTGKMNTYLKYVDSLLGVGTFAGDLLMGGGVGTAAGIGAATKMLASAGKSRLMLYRARLIAKMAYDPKFRNVVEIAVKTPESRIKTGLNNQIINDPVVRSIKNDLDKSEKSDFDMPHEPGQQQSGELPRQTPGDAGQGRQGVPGTAGRESQTERGSAPDGELSRPDRGVIGNTSRDLRQFIIDKQGNVKEHTGTFGADETIIDAQGNVVNRGRASGAALEMGQFHVKKFGGKVGGATGENPRKK